MVIHCVCYCIVQWNMCSVMAEVIIIPYVPSHPEIILQLSTLEVLGSIVVASIPNLCTLKTEDKLTIDFHFSKIVHCTTTSTTVHLCPEITLHLVKSNFLTSLWTYGSPSSTLILHNITIRFVTCVQFLCSSPFNGNFTSIQRCSYS